MIFKDKLNRCLHTLVSLCVVLCILFLVLPSSTGCSSTETTSPSTFLELLNLVPASVVDTVSSCPLLLIDYASAYAEYGITVTTPDDIATLRDKNNISYIFAAYGSFITGYGDRALLPLIRKNHVGYDVTCIDAEIQFGTPPKDAVVAIGRFNTQATDDALSHQDDWANSIKARYAKEEYHDIIIHSWGDGFKTDLSNIFHPPHLDQLGRAKPLAVTDRYLFYHPSIDAVKEIINSSQHQIKSLADLQELAAIANGLASLQAHIALVGGSDLAVGLTYTAAPLLKKFDVFGTGLGRDEKGTYVAVVLYHKNSDNALANVSLLKEHITKSSSIAADKPWSEFITDIQVNIEGNTLLAKLYTTDVHLWANWLWDYDNLLAHEE